MAIDLTPVFQAIISLAVALVTYKLIPWIKARTDEKQQNLLQATVKILVFAAEQMYGAGKGEEKLDYVIKIFLLLYLYTQNYLKYYYTKKVS